MPNDPDRPVGPTGPERVAELRRAALGLLARRDYSRKELRDRLTRRFGDDAALPELLDWLETQRFLDDARFAGMFFRSRVERGHGPLRIRQDMQQQGLSGELVEDTFAAAEVDWHQLAWQVCQRRFGAAPATDPRDRGRRLRFLQYRGFTGDQCSRALRGDPSQD